MIIGSNLNEGTIFIYPCFTENITEVQYEELINDGYDSLGPQLLEMYPYGNYLTPQAALSEVVGDGFVTCQVRYR